MSAVASFTLGLVVILVTMAAIAALGYIATTLQWPRPQIAWFGIGCAIGAVVVFAVIVRLAEAQVS